MSKLPRQFAIAWNESSNLADADIESLIAFLELRVKSREKYEFSHRVTREEPQKKSDSKSLKPFGSTASTLVNVVSSAGNVKKLRDSGCHFCKGAHRPMECPLSIEKRYEANQDRRCHNFLSVGHPVTNCYPHNLNCHNCSKRHHTALCRSGTNGP